MREGIAEARMASSLHGYLSEYVALRARGVHRSPNSVQRSHLDRGGLLRSRLSFFLAAISRFANGKIAVNEILIFSFFRGTAGESRDKQRSSRGLQSDHDRPTQDR